MNYYGRGFLNKEKMSAIEYQQPATERMREYLQLVATGPELSKSLSEDQAEDALSLILHNEVDAVRSGIFLIALRMKRETDAENTGALKAICGATQTEISEQDDVLVMSDPFNGFVRGLTALPFLPAVIASCGLPSYCHGVEKAGPKYGITPHRVLKMAGKAVDYDVTRGVTALSNEGWCYLDQSRYLPELHSLIPLRDQMVKRTCLSTLEVVIKPISGKKQTHLLTGFVHKAYPPVYAALAKQAGFDSAAVVRGVEGGCIPSLSQLSRYFGFKDSGEMKLHKLVPGEIEIHQAKRMVPVTEEEEALLAKAGYETSEELDSIIERNVTLGLEALSNKNGAMRDSLIYGAAIALNHTKVSTTLAEGATLARSVISSGEALNRFHG